MSLWRTLRVVTRGSKLAATQTGQLVDSLRRANPSVAFEIVTLKTTGDRVTDRPLTEFRGTGVFVKELEHALLNGDADMAMHSLKDVPCDSPSGLTLAAFGERADAADVLLNVGNRRLRELPHGAKVGTGSPRRIVQLGAQRPDLRFERLRGNLDTRIRKLETGEYDAIVVAAAGMRRLGIAFADACRLPFDVSLPAVGQGILAVECRDDDDAAIAVARTVSHEPSRIAALVERTIMTAIGGGCSLPLAALAEVSGETIRIRACLGDPAARSIARVERTCDRAAWEEEAAGVARDLLVLCREKGIPVP